MKTFIILMFLYCAPTLSNTSARNDEPEYIARTIISALKRIVETDIWKSDLSTRDVLFKGKITRLEDRPIKFPAEQTGSDSESDSESDDDGEDFINRRTLMKVSETSKLMYTALGCRFSDLIVETLRHFSKINSECQKIESTLREDKCAIDAVTVLIAHKRYIVKMMYDLFVFADAFPNLKFADQTLLKSLMSVNSYLYYLGKNDRYKGGVKITPHKKVLAQMINLVERWRCRKCLVIHGSLYFRRPKGEISIPISKVINDDFESTIRDILSPVTRQLESYYGNIDVTSLIILDAASSPNRRPYDDGMYDTENVLLGFVFDARSNGYEAKLMQSVSYLNTGRRNFSRGKSNSSVVATFMKSVNNLTNTRNQNSASDKWNRTKTLLIDVYENTVDGYDLKAMFDYQTLLMTVVGELFSAQFYHFFNQQSTGKCYGCPGGDCSMALTQLVTVYGVFINEVLPANYPPDSANTARRLYSLVARDLESFTALSAGTLAKHSDNVKIIDDWRSEGFVKILKDVQLIRLINNVVHHEYFDGFRRLFRLFLGEPNALKGYRMHSENDGGDEGRTTTNTTVCSSAYLLRQSMFLLQILMFGAKKLVPRRQSNGTDFAVLTMADGINEQLANAYDRYGHVYDEIKAILVPVSMRLRNVKIDDEYDYCLLTQYCLLTANLLEHFEINNCGLTYFSDEVYVELTDDRELFVYDGQQNVVDLNVARVEEFIALHTSKPGTLLDARLPRRRIAAHNEYTGPSSTTWWVHRYVPDGIFVVYNGSFNSNKINWDGTAVRMGRALKTMVDGDVIDYDQLVRYQLVRLQWSVHNVFEKMLYVANHIVVYYLLKKPAGANNSRETVDLLTIKNDISEIQNLPFSKPIATFLLPIFSEFTKMIDATFDERGDWSKVNQIVCDCVSTIEEQSRYLDAIVARAGSVDKNDAASGDIRNGGLAEPSVISLRRIHRELLDDREYITAVLKPSASFNAKIISENDFFYIY